MSRCGRTQSMEAVARGEVPAAVAVEARRHAAGCALCRHELNWLESEAALFRQRAGRDEVEALWQGFERRRPQAPDTHPWQRMLLAVAAAVLLLFVAGRLESKAPGLATASDEGALESEPLSSQGWFFEVPESCSRLPSGIGFQCSQPVPASFVASR